MPHTDPNARRPASALQGPELVVLGIAQDGGYPQTGCVRACCAAAWRSGTRARVASIGIVDGDRSYLVDCTPDFPTQLRDLGHLDGILLTHAHSGHYSGLMHLGPESWSPRGVPVWAMPDMTAFLRTNAPWFALEADGNVFLQPLTDGVTIPLGVRTKVTPRLVPHRGPWTETVGFVIRGPSRSALYLPDIDRWDVDHDPVRFVSEVDRAYLDGTFFSAGETPWRDPSRISHPFVEDTVARLTKLPWAERSKVRFIHLNHTNPLLDPHSDAFKRVVDAGMGVARDGERMPL